MNNKNYKKQLINHYILCGVIIILSLIIVISSILFIKTNMPGVANTEETTYIDTPINSIYIARR